MATLEDYLPLIQEASQKYGVDPTVIASMIRQESGFNPSAVSPKGAQGLMQLMPDTASQLGVQNAMDPRQNIDAGTKYFSQLLQQFGGDKNLALAAYNAGPGNVQKYGGVPPFAETQNYVRSIAGGNPSSTPMSPSLPQAGTFQPQKMTLADRLQQIAGILSLGAGSTADIIGAIKGNPGAGSGSSRAGAALLENASKATDQVKASEDLARYFNDPNLDPYIKAQAWPFYQARDYKGALDIFEKNVSNDQALRKSLYLQEQGINTALQKRTQADEYDRSKSLQLAGRLEDLISKEYGGEKLTGNERVEKLTLLRDPKLKGYLLPPTENQKMAPALQKIAQPVIAANAAVDFAERINTLLKKMPTGRFAGRALGLKELVAEMPELKQAEFLRLVERAKTMRGAMGEKGRIPYQLEQQVMGLLQDKKLYPKELDAVVTGIKQVAQSAVEDSKGEFLAIPGSTPESWDRFAGNINAYRHQTKETPANTIPPQPGETWEQYKARTGQ